MTSGAVAVVNVAREAKIPKTSTQQLIQAFSLIGVDET
jgi:hypothetical protein